MRPCEPGQQNAWDGIGDKITVPAIVVHQDGFLMGVE
jgi:hypothetical protein